MFDVRNNVFPSRKIHSVDAVKRLRNGLMHENLWDLWAWWQDGYCPGGGQDPGYGVVTELNTRPDIAPLLQMYLLASWTLLQFTRQGEW